MSISRPGIRQLNHAAVQEFSLQFHANQLVSHSLYVSENQLPTVKSFGKPRWGSGFNSTQPQQAVEKVLGKPLFASLRAEVAHQKFHLPATNRATQRDKEVRGAQVGIVFRDFVFQDQVVPKGVPSQLIDHSVILMRVGPGMREDQVWIDRLQTLLEKLFDLVSLLREVGVGEVSQNDGLGHSRT